jgi:uncharacterized SAM-binding protein YcdF (DUF218 family)
VYICFGIFFIAGLSKGSLILRYLWKTKFRGKLILRQAGITKILLVTDALHMSRALAMFGDAGLDVIPAPTIFLSRDRLTLLSFLPSGEGMQRSAYALHELLGELWYRMRMN